MGADHRASRFLGPPATTRIAFRELVRWRVAEYNYHRWDAYMMLSQRDNVRLGNFVDPKYTVDAAIPKKYL